ncbi:MAG: PEP-CTERM sorting domain-containing protein [Gemmatimonadales bacterium]|nr:PEP-CTERM sorting domain-containing protein [Gemmatimonadales bacterium]
MRLGLTAAATAAVHLLLAAPAAATPVCPIAPGTTYTYDYECTFGGALFRMFYEPQGVLMQGSSVGGPINPIRDMDRSLIRVTPITQPGGWVGFRYDYDPTGLGVFSATFSGAGPSYFGFNHAIRLLTPSSGVRGFLDADLQLSDATATPTHLFVFTDLPYGGSQYAFVGDPINGPNEVLYNLAPTGNGNGAAQWDFSSAGPNSSVTVNFRSSTVLWRMHVVPEPGTMVLLGTGVLGLVAVGVRKK